MVTIATVAISTTTRAVTTTAVTITLTLLILVEFLTTSVGSLEGGIMTEDDKVGEPGDEVSVIIELEI